MRFLSFVFRSVMRRRVRSALTVIGIAVAVGSVVALVGISRESERSFLSIYERQRISLMVLRAGAAQRLTSALDERLGDRIAALPGVHRVYAGLVDMMSLPELGPVGVLVQGWCIDSDQFDELKFLEGNRFAPADTDGILLGKTLAESLHKKVGDRLRLYETEDFRVVGVYQSYTVFENGGIIMPLKAQQRIMGREGQVTGFAVVPDNPADKASVERIRQGILTLDKNVDVLPTEDYVRSTSEVRLVRAMAWLTSAVALIIGTISILNTMVMSVFERTREIGILRAIGWRRARVVRMILLESVVLSLSGGVLGTIGAVLLIRYLSTFRAVAGMVGGTVDARTIGQGFLIALLVGLVGALYPAYRGAQLLPTEAIRHE